MFQDFVVYDIHDCHGFHLSMGGFKHWRPIGKATYTRGVVRGFISPKHQEFHHYGFLENPLVFAGRVSESLSSCRRYIWSFRIGWFKSVWAGHVMKYARMSQVMININKNLMACQGNLFRFKSLTTTFYKTAIQYPKLTWLDLPKTSKTKVSPPGS